MFRGPYDESDNYAFNKSHIDSLQQSLVDRYIIENNRKMVLYLLRYDYQSNKGYDLFTHIIIYHKNQVLQSPIANMILEEINNLDMDQIKENVLTMMKIAFDSNYNYKDSPYNKIIKKYLQKVKFDITDNATYISYTKEEIECIKKILGVVTKIVVVDREE